MNEVMKGTERGSVTRSGRGRLGVIEKNKPGLMFGRAAAHKAAVRTDCPRFLQATSGNTGLNLTRDFLPRR